MKRNKSLASYCEPGLRQLIMKYVYVCLDLFRALLSRWWCWYVTVDDVHDSCTAMPCLRKWASSLSWAVRLCWLLRGKWSMWNPCWKSKQNASARTSSALIILTIWTGMLSHFHATWTETGPYTGKWVLEEHPMWFPLKLLNFMPAFSW